MLEEKEDFFEQTPEEKPKKEKAPKEPKIYPDDPLYYEREEGRWEHLTPAPYNRGKQFIWLAAAVAVVCAILIGFYIYLFTPKVSEAVQYGYVENVQKEGAFFHTYEGVILPYKSLMDTVRPYEGDFNFSTRDVHIAAELKRRQGRGVPVKVEYKVYRQSLPWRGNTKVVVTAVDSVDPRTILPPDRQPALKSLQ